MTPAELIALRYSFMIGLTGTGESTADWFKTVYNLDTTYIPSTFPDRTIEEAPRVYTSKELKYWGIVNFLKTNNPRQPVLIDVESAQELDRLSTLLVKELGSSRPIRVLSADNAQDADRIFQSAGEAGSITVALRMAGREITIPTKEELLVIAASPRELSRNTIQLYYRTGRFGAPGRIVSFTCPQDKTWNILGKPEQQQLIQAIKREDVKNVDRLLDQAQQKHEAILYERNNQSRWLYRSLVSMRRELGGLPENQRSKLLSVWRDVIVTLETSAAQLHYSLPNLPLEHRYVVLAHEMTRLYERLERATTKPHFPKRSRRMLQLFLTTFDRRARKLSLHVENKHYALVGSGNIESTH
jgi:preprotein translocase subunit SecA